MSNENKTAPEMLTLDPATEILARKMFVDARERGDNHFRYTGTFNGAVNVLVLFAIERLRAQWKSTDESFEGRELRKALVEGKPLSVKQLALLQNAMKQLQPQQAAPQAPTPEAKGNGAAKSPSV